MYIFSDKAGFFFPGAPYLLAAAMLLVAAVKFRATARQAASMAG